LRERSLKKQKTSGEIEIFLDRKSRLFAYRKKKNTRDGRDAIGGKG